MSPILLVSCQARPALERVLAETAGVAVIPAGTMADARRCLHGMTLSLVIAEMILPDGDALKLAMQTSRTGIPLVVLAPDGGGDLSADALTAILRLIRRDA